jgi:hypothetical protein
MMIRFAGLLLISACAGALSLDGALSQLTPAAPQPPVTDSDQLISLALERAAAGGVPDFQPRRRVIIGGVSDYVTPNALPRGDSVAYFILDSAEIRRLAMQTGEFMYLVVGRPRITADSAVVAVGSVRAERPIRPVTVGVPGGGCAWLYRRSAKSWVFVRSKGCLIS